MRNIILMFLILGISVVDVCFAQAIARVRFVYKADFNNEQRPSMSFPEAFSMIKHELQAERYGLDGIQVTNKGFSFGYQGNRFSGKLNEIQSLNVTNNPINGSDNYCVIYSGDSSTICWASQNEAQSFVDAVMAMKYYTSRDLLADDATAFVDFQEKAKAWQALLQKPVLSEEARRFRVLADDAFQNKDFDKAANYYEQGLAIDPMWAAGQFNAAIIYGELELYPMAVMHMKRYLAFNPNVKDVKADQDKIYIWEEKVKDEANG